MAQAGELRTTYLGQFDEERAGRIVEALDAADIAWFHKQSGSIARWFFVGEWGVRLFVDGTRIDEARNLVERLVADEQETG